MTSAYSEPDTDSSQGPGAPGAGCDPDLLDDLKCRAKGIAAQAKYNADNEKALDDARAAYDGARTAYSTAWSAANPDVDKLGDQLDQITEQLRCLVNNDRKIRLLDEAFWHIERKLRKCYPNTGCTFDDDCDFDDRVDNCEASDIASVIADTERRTGVAAAAFAELIKEPANLSTRVSNLKAEIKQVDPNTPDRTTPTTTAPTAATVGPTTSGTQQPTDPPKADYPRRYAAALVAKDHLEMVWNGFSDINDYMDCLCRTLTCQIKGHAAISQLKRREATHQCHQEQRKAACEHLRDYTTDAVIAEYLRLKARANQEGQVSSSGNQSGYGGRGGDRGDQSRYRERQGEDGGGGRGSDESRDRYGSRDREMGRDRESYRSEADERGRS